MDVDREEVVERQHVPCLSTQNSEFRVKDFIWSHEEWPSLKSESFEKGDQVPQISLAPLLDDDGYAYEKICREMVDAGRTWGFFTLTHHGVPPHVVDRMMDQCNSLFDLPMEQKMKGSRSTALPLGYSASNPDYGRNLPWAEILQLLQTPHQLICFAKKVYGDDKYHHFSDALVEYLEALDRLGTRLLEMFAHGLGLADDFFAKNFEKEKEQTVIRVNRYPPCPLPEKCLGLGSHSDPHTLTILLQDQVGGLQVLKEDGEWVGIRPVPNSFVVNLGDTIEAWTNGRLKSVVHRAVVNKERKRLSAAYFMSPSSDTLINCPPQLIDHLEKRKYEAFTWGDFRKELLKQRRVVGKTALARFHL